LRLLLLIVLLVVLLLLLHAVIFQRQPRAFGTWCKHASPGALRLPASCLTRCQLLLVLPSSLQTQQQHIAGNLSAGVVTTLHAMLKQLLPAASVGLLC
jgi:hypothetical protein